MIGIRWLVAWLHLVGLLWCLDNIHAGAQNTRHVGFLTNAVSSTGVFRSLRPLFIRTHVEALDAATLDLAWLSPDADDGGPPWLDPRGPPSACAHPRASGTAAGHTGSSQEGQRAFAPGNFRRG